VYQSILNLFGKDVEKRFIPIFTFHDKGTPLALEAVTAAGIP
jgi:hypothetical protein